MRRRRTAASALAAVTLHEFLTPVQLLGAVVVLSSVAILQLGQVRRGPAPARPPAPTAAVADRA